MNAVGLLPIAELWKNIMSVKQLEMVPCDLALGVGISLVDTIREIFVQHVKKILTWKTKVNYLGC